LGGFAIYYFGSYAIIILLIKEWMDIILWGGIKNQMDYKNKKGFVRLV